MRRTVPTETQTASTNGNSYAHEAKYHCPSTSLYHRLTTNPYIVYPATLALFLTFHLTLSYLITGTPHYGPPPLPTPWPSHLHYGRAGAVRRQRGRAAAVPGRAGRRVRRE